MMTVAAAAALCLLSALPTTSAFAPIILSSSPHSNTRLFSDWSDFSYIDDDDDLLDGGGDSMKAIDFADENDPQELKAQVGSSLDPPEVDWDGDPLEVPLGEFTFMFWLMMRDGAKSTRSDLVGARKYRAEISAPVAWESGKFRSSRASSPRRAYRVKQNGDCMCADEIYSATRHCNIIYLTTTSEYYISQNLPGSALPLEPETIQGLLAACRNEIGTMFGYSAENRGVGITGGVDFVELDGPIVVLRLKGQFWH